MRVLLMRPRLVRSRDETAARRACKQQAQVRDRFLRDEQRAPITRKTVPPGHREEPEGNIVQVGGGIEHGTVRREQAKELPVFHAMFHQGARGTRRSGCCRLHPADRRMTQHIGLSGHHPDPAEARLDRAPRPVKSLKDRRAGQLRGIWMKQAIIVECTQPRPRLEARVDIGAAQVGCVHLVNRS